MKNNMKKIYMIGSTTIISIILVYLLSYQQIAKPQFIVLESVKVDENEIVVSGFNYGGFFNYVGYEVEYKEKMLFITFKGGWRLPYMPKTNCPDFYPIKNEYDEIEKIYLKGSFGHKNDRLIWNSEKGEILRDS
ncbi:MAG: hypothetical protein RSE93_03855 [Oscillospiraceae bacterium]